MPSETQNLPLENAAPIVKIAGQPDPPATDDLPPEEVDKLLRHLAASRARDAQKPTSGERYTFAREGLPGVAAILYRPKAATGGPLPVVFNLHGGAWIGGDAILMESFCQLLADRLPALVVNLNYTKADVQPLPFAQYELRDAVLQLAADADSWGADAARVVVGGHSAGAHIAAGAAMLLRDAGFALAGQLLVYPATDPAPQSPHDPLFRLLFANGGLKEPWASPLRAPDDCLRGLAPALGIFCGRDELREQGMTYFERLKQNGVPTDTVEYPKAEHGFLEVNRPDYPADPRQTPEQAALARAAEEWIVEHLRRRLGC